MYNELIVKSENVSQVMNILSHPKRLAMLCLLSEKERNIGELTQMLEISQSLVSQFALKMKDQGILTSEKDGKEVYYILKDESLLKLMQEIKKIYC